MSIPLTNTTFALVMPGSLYNQRNLKKSWIDHLPPLPHSLLNKEGHLSSVLFPFPPHYYRLHLTFSGIDSRKESLYFSKLKRWILTVHWRTILLSQPSKGMGSMCYFASMTSSRQYHIYFTGKLTRYLNAYLDIKQCLLFEEMYRIVKSREVTRSQ